MIKNIKLLFRKNKTKDKEQDWFEWADVVITPKQELIEKCKKYGVYIYEDDKMENESSPFRGVASQVELQKRLNAKLACIKSNKKDIIDLRLKKIGLIVAILGLTLTVLISFKII
jgi:hypothetical protein